MYVTKPRAAAGTAGEANSASPLFDPATTAVATQPGAAAIKDTLLDNYNPFSNGNPSTAYSALAGGIQGALATATTFGDVENVVAMLDLYRVTKTTGTDADSETLWHNANNVEATYSNNSYPASNGARADFLGTVTLSNDGTVNFVSKGIPGPLYLSSASLPYGGEILSYADGKLLSTNSGNGAYAIQFYAIDQNGTLTETGSADLSSTVADEIESIDTGYSSNDVLLFLQNPAGTVGTDQVAYISLGSAVDVFRDAPAAYTILGNINDTLTATFGADWINKASSIFVGAAGQNGATSALSTAISNGDYARTVYVTKPRAGEGTEGQSNSASPLFDPATTAVPGQIAGANNIAGMTQPVGGV